MKRLSYIACLLLTTATFTACNEDFKDWAEPQSNPQEEAITATVNLTSITPLKLEECTDDSVVIATVASIADECALKACKVQLSAEGQTLNLSSKVKDGNVKVRVTELDQKVATLYKSQKMVAREVTLNLTPIVITTLGEATSLTGYPEFKVSITPVATPPADTEYYMVGGLNGWQMAKQATNKFTVDTDNPHLFHIIVKSEEKFEFKIVPGSAVEASDAWQRALGAFKNVEEPDPSLLTFRNKEGQDPENLSCPGGKKMRISINVEDYTYSIKEDLPESMFINGSAYSSDWNWASAAAMIPVTQAPGMFWSMQYYAAGDQIKFCPIRKWDGDFGYSDDYFSQATIDLAGLTSDGGNIKIGKTGWYLVVVTVTTEGKTIAFYAPDVYLLGGLVGGSWNCDASTKFTVPTTKEGNFVSPAATSTGMARICVTADGANNWWKSEFTLDLANGGNGTIIYRENKSVGDNLSELGYICNLAIGQKISLNFLIGKGSVQ